jgi:hypothetical protein
MTLRIDTFHDAYRIAHAAGWDAGNRRMAGEQRAAWDAEDWNHAVATFHRVLAALGFAESGSRLASESVMVPAQRMQELVDGDLRGSGCTVRIVTPANAGVQGRRHRARRPGPRLSPG